MPQPLKNKTISLNQGVIFNVQMKHSGTNEAFLRNSLSTKYNSVKYKENRVSIFTRTWKRFQMAKLLTWFAVVSTIHAVVKDVHAQDSFSLQREKISK